MGIKDLQKKGYLYDPERFADLVNGVVCAGRQVLAAADLTELDSQAGQFGLVAYGEIRDDGAGGNENDRAAGRENGADSGGADRNRRRNKNQNKKKSGKLKDLRRDLVRRAAFGVNFMVVGIENQGETDYLMPLRCMSYDTAEYEKQAAQIRRKVRKSKKVTNAEFLSGFAKDSRLHPCVTIVLYYGEDCWDGATALREILDLEGIPPELQQLVNDYKIYLCEVRKFENTEVFKTDVKQVFDCLRYAKEPDKLQELLENDPSYRQMEPDTYDVIAEYTKTSELMKVKTCSEKEGKIDMCKAITELIERGRRDGMERGIEQGIAQGITQGIEQGIERGVGQGMIKAITELLEDFGQIPQRVLDLIQNQDDPATLSRWLKSAAKAENLAEFEQNM